MTYKLPRQLMRTKREGQNNVELTVFKGALPTDIDGFAWFMLPAGDFNDGEFSKAKARNNRWR